MSSPFILHTIAKLPIIRYSVKYQEMISMKKSSRYCCFFLLPVLFLGACASRPRPVAEKEQTITPPVITPAIPPEIPPAIPPTITPEIPPAVPPLQPPQIFTPTERILLRVQQNESDIEKYYILDEEGKITVKAIILDETEHFEVIYDLENAENLMDSTFRVPFLLAGKSGVNLKDTMIWKPLAANAGLLLSFDDDYVDSWEQHFDLFDQHGAKVTFFVQGIPNSFCIEALSRGHDVGYHSLNHLDLTKVSGATFAKETFEPMLQFRHAGIPLTSFAFPFGFSEQWMHEILLQSFGILRGYGVTFRLYHDSEIRSAYIISQAIDNIVIPDDEDFDKKIRLMLRTIKFLGGSRVLPLTTHDISDTAAWGISRRRLEFLLKTASDLGLRFYLYSDFTDNL